MNYRRVMLIILLVCIVVTTIVVFQSFINDANRFQLSSETSISTTTTNELLMTIQQITVSSENCQLPCFWGFTPGVTTLNEVQNFFDTQFNQALRVSEDAAQNDTTFSSASFDLLTSNSNHEVGFSTQYEMETLRYMDINLMQPNEWVLSDDFDLSVIIASLDPTQVYIGINTPDVISLILINPDRGTLIRYGLSFQLRNVSNGTDEQNRIVLCPANEFIQNITFHLQAADEPRDLTVFLGNATLGISDLQFYQPVAWMTNLEPGEFLEQVMNSPDECIPLPSFQELNERGYGW